MRTIFLFMMVSLDGYFEGVNHDLSWHHIDDEFSTFAEEQLDETDTLLFGRRTYDMMEAFWPTEEGAEAEPGTAVRMNALHKIAFSFEPFETHWENAECSTDVIGKINELRHSEGKTIAVLGSSELGKYMIEHDLLDELRIMVNPVFIGKGTTLFDGLITDTPLALTKTRTFNNGNMLLTYSLKK